MPGNRLAELKEKVRGFPQAPGVYKMWDREGRLIYVGKAGSLRKRVMSYFSSTYKGAKTERLLKEVWDISYELAEDEHSALLMEERLIKEHRPKYNIALRDDKTYPLLRIGIRDEGLPRVQVVRRPEKDEKARFFGPFANVKLLRMALKGLRFLYPFRTCRTYRKSCVYADIGLCLAPCKREVSPEEYARVRDGLVSVFSGDFAGAVEELFRRMNESARREDFESASFFRDSALALSSLLGAGTVEQGGLLAVYDLKERLDLPILPRRIEGFDVSNIMGEYAVASMVSFWDGRPDKKNYRRYRIKTVEGANDVAMIYEVVKRRCVRIARGEFTPPDLFLIDGGPAQLKSALKALMETNLEIYVVALAKEREEVYLPGRRQPIVLPRESAGLRLLQAVRDEAHRFAITYHRKLRHKGLIPKRR